MTRRPIIIASCWAGSVVLAVIVTRWTAPTKTVEVVREVQVAAEVREEQRQVEQVAAAEQTSQQVQQAARSDEQIRVVYRRIKTAPDGASDAVELELAASRSAALDLTARLETAHQRIAQLEQAQTSAATMTATESERRVEVVRLLPTWRVEGMIGVDQDFDFQFGGAASARILGPITAGGWGLLEPAPKPGAGLQWAAGVLFGGEF